MLDGLENFTQVKIILAIRKIQLMKNISIRENNIYLRKNSGLVEILWSNRNIEGNSKILVLIKI